MGNIYCNIIAQLTICVIWVVAGILNAPKKGKGRVVWYTRFIMNAYIPLVVQILCSSWERIRVIVTIGSIIYFIVKSAIKKLELLNIILHKICVSIMYWHTGMIVYYVAYLIGKGYKLASIFSILLLAVLNIVFANDVVKKIKKKM